MVKKSTSGGDILARFSQERPQKFTSTGSIALDALFGGGICHGSMYCLWGAQGSGKSTISFQIAKKMCKSGEKVAFLDVEKALNKNQQDAFGLTEFIESGLFTIFYPDTYDDIYQIGKALADSEEYRLVIVDSETQTSEVLPGDVDITSMQPGQKARQSERVLKALKSLFYYKDIASIWLCHARANITMSANPYQDKEKQAGGYGIKHTPDLILRIQAGQKIKDGDKIVGQIIHLQADKNKFTKPFQTIDVKIFFGKGIVRKIEVVDFAIQQGLIKQSSSFFTLPDGTTVRGTTALYDMDSAQLTMLKNSLGPIIE